MKICLLGDFTGNPDEGMKNISINIKERLKLKHHVLFCNLRDIFKKERLKKILLFQPDIIHYLHGPTIRSLIILKFLKLLNRNKSKTISSATKPYFSRISKRYLPLLRTDLILTQSQIWEKFFNRYKFHNGFLPNGIDNDKFYPASQEEKINIRKKYHISNNDFIILHVGHIRKNRNLNIFKIIQSIPKAQVVIVSGKTVSSDLKIKNELISCGCKIINEFIENVSEVYKMADLYIFPTKYNHKILPDSYNQIGAIETPLSVLEAMSCNLPVVATEFGSLKKLIKQKEGFYFSSNDNEIILKTMGFILNRKNTHVNTREQVLILSWDNVIKSLEQYYEEILKY